MKPSWRRRFVRILGWWIAAFASVLAVSLLILAVYLLFFDYPEAVREQLEVELSELAGAPAHVGSIDLDIVNYAFELTDISVEGRTGEDEDILTLDRVWGRLRLSEIARLRLHWTDLIVQGLSVRIDERSEGALSFPRDVGNVPPGLVGAGVAFSADRIVLEDAVIALSNEDVPWRLEASNLGLDLRRRANAYRGTLSYDDGVLWFGGQEPIEGSVSADIELSGGELLVHEARGETAMGTVVAVGKLGLGGGYNGRFELNADLDVERASEAFLELETGLLTGAATFNGTFSVSPDARELVGELSLPEGSVRNIPLRDWTAVVSLDRDGFRVSDARGRIASGRCVVSFDQVLPSDQNPAAIDVEVSDAELEEILEGLGRDRARGSPFTSRVSGRGQFVLDAQSPRGVSGSFELTGSIPTRRDSSVETFRAPVGIDMRARGRIAPNELVIESFDWATSTASGTVSGAYPRDGSAELLVDLESVDLAQADALARSVRAWFRGDDEGEPELWGIGGRGRAQGRLTGRLPHPVFYGSFEAPLLLFDRLSMEDVEARTLLSRGNLRFEDLVGRRADGTVTGSGSLSLEGEIGSRDFDLDLSVSRWPLSDLASLVDWNTTVDGLVSGEIDLGRSVEGLDGAAELDITQPVIAGQTFDRLETRTLFEGQEIRLERAELSRGASRLSGELALDIQSGAVDGAVSTRSFPIDGADFLGLELHGRLEANASVSGSLDAPVIDLTARARDVDLAGASLQDAAITARVLDRHVVLDVQLGEALMLQADAELAGELPITGTLRFVELDAGPWIERISELVTDTTRALLTGGAHFTAELRRASSLQIDATLTRVQLENESVRLESLAPVEARYEDGIVRMPSLTLADGDSRVAVDGAVNVVARTLDLRFEGTTDLALIESLYPDLAATGSVDLSARVSGGWDNPSLSGRADLDGSSLRLEGFPQALGGLRGRLVFDNRTIRIPDLEGVFGSGPVSFSGAISLDGLAAGSLDLQASGTGMRLRYPEGLVAVLDADLALVGTREEPVLSGDVTLTDAVWTREYDLVAGILTDSEGYSLFEELADNQLFSGLNLDVSIVAPRTLRLRNTLAEIDGSAQLELRGSLAQPVLLGTTEAERGEVYFLGQRYDITAGKVDFVDPTKVEPFIELTAETRVRSYRVELRLTGTSDRFYPELSSDPPLRTVDILRLLSGANERDILIGTEEEEIAGVGVASLLTERLSQELGRRAERLFGLDRFSIDPFLVGQIANPTARVSLGKQITRDLSINYSTNLNATTEAIILIEYTPEGNTSWILSRDEEGDVGIDVKFRKSF